MHVLFLYMYVCTCMYLYTDAVPLLTPQTLSIRSEVYTVRLSRANWRICRRKRIHFKRILRSAISFRLYDTTEHLRSASAVQ